jgi:Zn-dependent peptidase ImmA (M78 family)
MGSGSRHRLDVLRFSLGNVDGILVTIEGDPTIGFNGDASWVRKRFTIAHEIGHFLLGHTCEGADIDSEPEREANQFAAEFLIPIAFVKEDYKANPDLDDLAKKYIVSKTAMCLHLMECKVLKYN